MVLEAPARLDQQASRPHVEHDRPVGIIALEEEGVGAVVMHDATLINHIAGCLIDQDNTRSIQHAHGRLHR